MFCVCWSYTIPSKTVTADDVTVLIWDKIDKTVIIRTYTESMDNLIFVDQRPNKPYK